MKDEDYKKDKLIDELIELRQKIIKYQKIEEKLKLSESRLEAVLKLNQMTEAPLKEITDFALEEGVRLTGSSLGYIAFYDEDKAELIMHSWSKKAMEQCVITDKPIVYQLEKTGLWGEAIRQRKPVITNNYLVPNPLIKGYPDGHVHLFRHMNIPVFDGEHIVLVAGVGNKKEEYNDSDINQLTLLMSGMWRIIQRKRAEEALRESEVNYRTIFNSANDAIFINNIGTGDIIDANQKVYEMFGYTPEEARCLNVESISAGKQQYTKDHVLQLFEKAAKGELQLVEWLAKHKSGRLFWIEVNLKPVVIRGKNCILAIARDITERKQMEEELGKYRDYLKEMVNERTAQLQTALTQLQLEIDERVLAEEALRLSEERFSKAFNASSASMTIASHISGKILDANDSFLRLYGYRLEEVLGHSDADLNLWVDLEDYKKAIHIINEQRIIQNIEYRFRKKSGEIFVGLYSGVIISLNGKQCILSIMNDVTERKHFQQEMARLDRLNLVGQMAAGIGHEIRNPMTTVRGFIQLLSKKKKYAQDKEYFDLMIEELDRANFIITEFLSLAKNKVIELRAQNLNSIVKAILPLIQSDAIKNNNNIKVYFEEIPELLLDEKEIRQIILNLVRNGLEAMPSGGQLVIRTFIDREEVILSVKDEGEGIPFDVLEKIGTPFFTTKENGTGLGLAVCYSIAARHNAKIEIETGPTGTKFFVRFKQSDKTIRKPLA